MHASGHRQRGSGLLEIALLVLLVGAAIAAGFVYLKAQVPARQAQAQEQALAWADQAVVAFAAAYGRLPCPAITPGAIEDCGAGAKGWLPAQTLEDVKPRLDADGPGHAVAPMRYLVYRGAGADLAQATNSYEPWVWDSDSGKPANWGFGAINGLDFCTSLASAGTHGYDAGQAHTDDPQGAPANIAYGIAAAGMTAGTTGRFDGANNDNGPALESPSRQAGSDYDDRVRVRDFSSLGQAMSCATTLASVESVGRATDVWGAAVSQQENNQQDAQISISNAAVALLLQGADVTEAVGDIVSSTVTLGTISAELAAAITACALPPWVQCALIPVFTAAEGIDIAAVAASAGSIATNVVALALTSAALGLSIDAAVKAGADIDQGMAGVDPGTVVDQKTIDEACNIADDLSRKEADAQKKLNEKTQKRDAALARFHSDLAKLSPEKDRPDEIDTYGKDVLAYAEAKNSASDAVGATEKAEDELKAWNESNGGSCDNPKYCSDLPPGTTFESLDEKCASATDETLKKLYCDARDRIRNEASVKEANLVTAQQNEANARAAAAAARTAYLAALGVLPDLQGSCSVGGSILNCGDSLVVNLTKADDNADRQFNPPSYHCSGNGDGSGIPTAWECDINGLRARQVYDDAMGYPSEATAHGNPGDDHYFDPEAQLGADGYVSLVHQVVAAGKAYADAQENTKQAKQSCDDLSSAGHGIPTHGGVKVEIWVGPEDVIRQVDNQGTEGPVKPPVEAKP
jgi:type II secretory pathway pseudopilin PulG